MAITELEIKIYLNLQVSFLSLRVINANKISN